MKIDINKLQDKHHNFIEAKYNEFNLEYYTYTCIFCKLIITAWCNNEPPIWANCSNIPFYNHNELENGLLTCDEVIVKNIIE